MRLSRDIKYGDVKEILVSRKFDYLLCTAGEDGVFDYDRNGVTHLEGRGVQVADVTGASDLSSRYLASLLLIRGILFCLRGWLSRARELRLQND